MAANASSDDKRSRRIIKQGHLGHEVDSMTNQTFEDFTDDATLSAGTGSYSVQSARAIVQHFADVTTAQDADFFANGFTRDCVVFFPPLPLLLGREAVRAWRASRPRYGDFKCRKTLRSLSGNVFGVTYFSRWSDPVSRAPQERRGVEFWIMNGEQIQRWDCCSATYAPESVR
jgi:ketosteroid isomerase-like protein